MIRKINPITVHFRTHKSTQTNYGESCDRSLLLRKLRTNWESDLGYKYDIETGKIISSFNHSIYLNDVEELTEIESMEQALIELKNHVTELTRVIEYSRKALKGDLV